MTYGNFLPAGSNERHALELEFKMQAIGSEGVTLPTTGQIFSIVVVPEPSSALLLLLGLSGLSLSSRRDSS